jgi:glucuronate isomerase
MLPDRNNLKRMLTSLDVAIASAAKVQPDEDDFRTALRAFVRLLTLEAGEADRDWVNGQLEEMLARHGLKDFGL